MKRKSKWKSLCIDVFILFSIIFVSANLNKISRVSAQQPEETQQKPQMVVQTGHRGAVTSVVISNSNKYVVTGSGDSTAKLWDIHAGKEIRTFYGHTSIVNSIAMSSDEKYIITGSAL